METVCGAGGCSRGAGSVPAEHLSGEAEAGRPLIPWAHVEAKPMALLEAATGDGAAYQAVQVSADGSCFYASLAECFAARGMPVPPAAIRHGSGPGHVPQWSARAVQETLLRFVEAHLSTYEPYLRSLIRPGLRQGAAGVRIGLAPDAHLSDIVAGLMQPGVWAEAVCVAASAAAFNITVAIVAPETAASGEQGLATVRWLRPPSDTEASQAAWALPVVLRYSGAHYTPWPQRQAVGLGEGNDYFSIQADAWHRDKLRRSRATARQVRPRAPTLTQEATEQISAATAGVATLEAARAAAIAAGAQRIGDPEGEAAAAIERKRRWAALVASNQAEIARQDRKSVV